MKRLLFLSYYFPPHLVAESLLSGRTAKSLANLGWDVEILSNLERAPWTANDPGLLGPALSNLPTTRVGGLERLFPYRKMLEPARLLGLPEPEFLWIPAARSAGRRLLRQRKFDIIHSWACCHAGNVAGLLLKRESGLPWVAHFSDPWVDNPYWQPTPLQRKVSRHLEEAVIREADLVVFTTEETVDLVMAKYPEAWRSKVLVVPHGYDPDSLDAAPQSPARDKLRLTYTGGLYGIRSPEWLFHALGRLKERSPGLADLEVVFVGPTEARHPETATRLGLDGIVRFAGTMAFKEAMREAGTADALLVIDAPAESGSPFLPSKLVDYLLLDKPILGLTPLQGASASLLRRLDCPIVAPDDVGGIATALEKLLLQWKSGALGTSENFKDTAARYHTDSTTGLLSERMEACIARAS
jgi:hypothetical protein